jgi:hypothetical protein
MARSDDKLEVEKPQGNGLESYRRLIELQKQMIELSQHHERFRRECEALRDVVAREAAEQARGRQGPMGRLRASALNLFKRSPLALARQLFS